MTVSLFLSICCIGAMCSLEQKTARALWEQSRAMVVREVSSAFRALLIFEIAEMRVTPGEFPLWIVQAQFLNCWYAA